MTPRSTVTSSSDWASQAPLGVSASSHTPSSVCLCAGAVRLYDVRVGGLGPGGLADPLGGTEVIFNVACLFIYPTATINTPAKIHMQAAWFSLPRYASLQIRDQEKEDPQGSKDGELLKAPEKISLRTLVICLGVQNLISEHHLPRLITSSF